MTTTPVSQAAKSTTKRKPSQKQTWKPKPLHDYTKTTQPNGQPWRANPARPITLEEARRIAYHMHRDQKDKAGQPYREHLAAVEKGTEVLGGSIEERIAALFHDAVEDHHTTYKHLEALGLTPHTIATIEAVSKRPNEEQGKYLARIKAQGHSACRVKLADLMHNTRHDRMQALIDAGQQHTVDRLRKKYRPAMAALMLELGLIVDEDEHKKLATKPLGSSYGTGTLSTGTLSSGWKGSSQKGNLKNKPNPLHCLTKSMLVGDWPVGWDAPVIEADHHDGETTFTLANGEVRTEKWNGTLHVYAHFTWGHDSAVDPSNGKAPQEAFADYTSAVEKAKDRNTTSSGYLWDDWAGVNG